MLSSEPEMSCCSWDGDHLTAVTQPVCDDRDRRTREPSERDRRRETMRKSEKSVKETEWQTEGRVRDRHKVYIAHHIHTISFFSKVRSTKLSLCVVALHFLKPSGPNTAPAWQSQLHEDMVCPAQSPDLTLWSCICMLKFLQNLSVCAHARERDTHL